MKSKNGIKASLSHEKPFVTYFSKQNKWDRERPSTQTKCHCCGEVKRIAQRGLCFFCVMGDCHCHKIEYIDEPEESFVMEEIRSGRDTPQLWHWKRIFDSRREGRRFAPEDEI